MPDSNPAIMKKAPTNLSAITKKPWFSSIVSFIVIFLGMTLLSPKLFLTGNNLMNIVKQCGTYAIMAIGMSFAIIVGGIDLSQGSLLAVVAIVTAKILRNGEGNMALAIVAGIAVGALIGAFNGFLVGFLNVPAFIATLGTQNALRGLALILTNATPVTCDYGPFRVLGTGYLFGIPYAVFLILIVGIIAQFILSKTATGRQVYAVGSNAEAARLSGISVKMTKLKAHIFSSMAVSIAAILYISRLGAAQPTAGQSYESEAIVAAVLGGTSITGGEGSAVGSVIGAISVMIIRNGMVLLNVSTYWQQLVIGMVLITAVVIDITRKSIDAKKVK